MGAPERSGKSVKYEQKYLEKYSDIPGLKPSQLGKFTRTVHIARTISQFKAAASMI